MIIWPNPSFETRFRVIDGPTAAPDPFGIICPDDVLSRRLSGASIVRLLAKGQEDQPIATGQGRHPCGSRW
jgi:hypothetical protein